MPHFRILNDDDIRGEKEKLTQKIMHSCRDILERNQPLFDAIQEAINGAGGSASIMQHYLNRILNTLRFFSREEAKLGDRYNFYPEDPALEMSYSNSSCIYNFEVLGNVKPSTEGLQRYLKKLPDSETEYEGLHRFWKQDVPILLKLQREYNVIHKHEVLRRGR